MSNPETIVQQQLEAYNARQLETFVACFSENVVVRELQDGEINKCNGCKFRLCTQCCLRRGRGGKLSFAVSTVTCPCGCTISAGQIAYDGQVRRFATVPKILTACTSLLVAQ